LQRRALARWSEQQEASRRRWPWSLPLYPALAAGLLLVLLALISGRWSPDHSRRPPRRLATAGPLKPILPTMPPRPKATQAGAAAETVHSSFDQASAWPHRDAAAERTRGGKH